MIYQTYQKYLQFQKRVSKHTYTAYTSDIESFFAYYNSEIVLEEISVEFLNEIHFRDIRNWIVELSNHGIEAKSIHRKISSLNSFFKFLNRNNYLQHNPVSKVILPKIKKRLPEFFSEEQMAHFPKGENFETIDQANPILVLELFYQTGMRASELVNLKSQDFNRQKLQIKVLGKGNKERIIPISTSLALLLDQYEQLKLNEGINHPNLLSTPTGHPLYYQYIYRLVKAQLQQHTSATHTHPHILRHTFASHLLNNGAELNSIKELLVHSSLSSTQVYTHNSIKKLQEVYQKAHPKA
jgi:integrase/recombinase XerC